ncbi:hypothetical protein [Hyunsoonleella rubra]|uniref:Uncharacterized protein n=1 Tax=Hyunsoonleella rubra TaxID=1737062 RepID=A0ABW5TFC2_9FLAO
MLWVAFLLLSCGPKIKSSANTNTTIEQPPQLIFLNYSIAQNSNGIKTVKLLSSKKVEGKIKGGKFKNNITQNDLICYQLKNKSSVISKIVIEDPLHKRVEYLGESRSFKVAQIESDSAYFSIRLQLNPETRYIAIGDNTTENYFLLSKVKSL